MAADAREKWLYENIKEMLEKERKIYNDTIEEIMSAFREVSGNYDKLNKELSNCKDAYTHLKMKYKIFFKNFCI